MKTKRLYSISIVQGNSNQKKQQK